MVPHLCFWSERLAAISMFIVSRVFLATPFIASRGLMFSYTIAESIPLFSKFIVSHKQFPQSFDSFEHGVEQVWVIQNIIADSYQEAGWIR